MTAQGAGRQVVEEATGNVQGLWDGVIEFFQWESLLPRLVPAVLQLIVILLLAFVSYRLVRIFTGRLTRREIDEQDPLIKRVREQRAQTLAGLLNYVALIVIAAIAFLMVLGAVGIELGPLLATAGIAGLAISFGAQSLVKDLFTGMFLLIEGQFGIGDVVRIGDVAGQVEKITLRTTIMRDLHGVVHIIPNGEITRVSNLTKTWSRSVLDIGVAYKEDVDRVIALLRDLGQEFQRDPDWAPLLLEPPEVLGVQEFLDSAVAIRLSTKTLPLKQWDVARELRRRIKNRFDAEGVEIPFPHRTFYWGEGQLPPALGEPAGRELPAERPAGDGGRG